MLLALKGQKKAAVLALNVDMGFQDAQSGQDQQREGNVFFHGDRVIEMKKSRLAALFGFSVKKAQSA